MSHAQTLTTPFLPAPPLGASAIELLTDGLARHRTGDHIGAERVYRSALELLPHLPQGLHLLGVLLTETGRALEARTVLRQAALLRPGHADTRLALARACAECGDTPEAIALLRAVLADRPRDVGLMLGLAHLHARTSDHEAALSLCRDASAVAPHDAHARAALACSLAQTGYHALALNEAEAALGLDPGQADAWLARGAALRALGRPAEAVDALEHGLMLAPGHPGLLLALGNARADCGHGAAAADMLRAAVARGPDVAASHASLSAVLAAEGFLPEAIAAGDAAIACDPTFAPGWWNRAVARLLAGDLAGGFADAEWRRRHPRFAADFAALAGPEWDGGPLAGQRLLVHAGQGMGDTIQFARYLPALIAAAAAVTVVCASPLVRLLAQIEGVTVTRRSDGMPPHDLWIDQMSLPHHLGSKTLPSPEGYLSADPARSASWRRQLGRGLRVGLVWAGNPAHGNDRNRSLPPGEAPRLLRPLQRLAAALPGLCLVSLQTGPRHAELGIADFSTGLGDFADTAALVAELDLVITVDTATAHLAGALGKPVWVMLPFAPDWRWQLIRHDSPWYASMRLFRQPAPGDWDGVIRAVAAALRVQLSGGASEVARYSPAKAMTPFQ